MGKTVVIGIVVVGAFLLMRQFGGWSNRDLVGMWKDTDGTVRTFSQNGTCRNIAKIDIGGPAPTCELSEKQDASGYYQLYVQQGGYNQTNFYVKVVDQNDIKIYESHSAPTPMYTLTRQ